ncbi:unnamed protein product [Haemonchus placei]|uniref:Uncharacterized protein n=1 Tax=Haemonchus placei TaxID=6290 RepID=A0A3P7Y9A9_HAEPC|nr:unnamed protein product [Haemonchus placei]
MTAFESEDSILSSDLDLEWTFGCCCCCILISDCESE